VRGVRGEYLDDMSSGVDRKLSIQHSRRDEELLQEELQTIALVHVIHKDQPLALHRHTNRDRETERRKMREEEG
jgi:hypothetical protein